MKILALYLPQYHTIKENDEWWGEGYTEWNAVRRAKPLFHDHNQPRKPLNDNYYDLSDESGKVWKWQAGLANRYGVYGFCIYHYWFGRHQLLEKPMEILLAHPEIDIHYCACWANETWTRTWYGLQNEILMEQTYGGREEWKRHFDYLLPFFMDSRYIKIDNKPMMNIYHSADIENLQEMCKSWEQWAQKAGFDGVFWVSGLTSGEIDNRGIADAYYEFEPGYTLKHSMPVLRKLSYWINTYIRKKSNSLLKKGIIERVLNASVIYHQIENHALNDRMIFPGTFPQWDNTPRRAHKGLVYKETSPGKFKAHLKRLIERVPAAPYDYLYINAWNEWGEGAYLEPDNAYGYRYLKAVRDIQNERE